MKIKFIEEAQHELDEAIDYYNLESPGLGDQFCKKYLIHLIESPTIKMHGIPCPKTPEDVRQDDFLMV